MSKWKTSTRRNRKLATSESAGNLSLPSYGSAKPEDSDSSSLSFLDDMLAGGGSGTGSGRNSKHQSSSHQQQGGDIDDILDLVGSSHNDASRNSGGSGHRRRDTRRGEPEGYNNNSNNNSAISPMRSRTVQRYGSRSHSRSHSRGPDPRSREHSLDPAAREPYAPSDDRRSGGFKFGADRPQDLNVGSDHVTPIPVFTVNTNHHDDDSLSQITTSVTSHYDVDSSRSGSFPWSKQNQRGHSNNNNTKNISQGDSSYADTLDEIAEMLHPGSGGGGGGGGRMTPNSSRHQSDHYRHPKSPGGSSNDDFFRPATTAKVDDLFGKPHNYNGNNGNNRHSNNPADAPPLNADEIYRSSKKSHRNWGEPLISQTRLLIRYWMSLALPREWRRKVGGKADDEQGYLGTYQNKKLPRSRQRRKFCSSLLSSVMGFFFCMTVLMLVTRLFFLHAQLPKWAKNMGGRSMQHSHKSHPKKGSVRHSVVSAEVHGGMAVRSDTAAAEDGDGGSGGGGNGVAGGMAHHSVKAAGSAAVAAEEDLLQPPKKGEYSHHGHIGVELPSDFDHFADVSDLPVQKGENLPFFWHVPRAAGGTVNDIFGGCLGLTLASDAGASGEAGKENRLKKVKFSKHFTYVNVDTSTPEGIERARQLELADSRMADVVISTLLHQTASLFSNRHKGRLFTIVRHPVERAVSLFHYVQDTQWRRRQTFQKELSELSIEEYFESGLAENNWMTRFLINEPTKGELTRDDVNMAKEILRRKCLVGVLSQKGESFARFERYFGFPLKDDEQKDCHEKKLQWAWPLKHRHDDVEENTPLWDLILTHNVFDMELYHYASEVVFNEQAKMFQ